MKTRTKLLTGIIAILLSCVLLFTYVIFCNNTNNGQVSANSRTVELSQSAVDAQSVLNEFDDATLTREGSTVYFEGYKPIDKNVLTEIDYISETDFEELENCTTKYNFSYNSETNIVTIAATATLADGTVEVDEISGVGFINDKDEIDAVMNIDGEGILLSEMRDAGMIQNCGWFSKLIKAIVTAVVVVAVVAVVAATVVATAGAAAPALVAVGVGAASSTAVAVGSAAVGAAAGILVASTVGMAAIQAGTAIAEVIGDGAEQIIDKVTGAVIAFLILGVEYATKVVDKNLEKEVKSGDYRFVALTPNCSVAYVTVSTVSYTTAVWGLRLGLNTYSVRNDAMAAAYDAGNGKTPRLHDYYHSNGGKKRGVYFYHFHTYPYSVTYDALGFEIPAGHACFGQVEIIK